jgi:BirA family biotin operon repressor/biotin-[acetyl-CoA-carboxylase] ligase
MVGLSNLEQSGPITESFADSSSRFRVYVEHFRNIDSTQTYLTDVKLKTLSESALKVPYPVHVASADHQEKGKGKGARSWFSSQEHSSVAMSVQLPVSTTVLPWAPFVTQILALAVTQAIGHLIAPRSVSIKWPNDILLAGNKIGGILAQLFPVNSDFSALIIGVGINLDIPVHVMTTGVGERPQWPAGSVKQLTGVTIESSSLRRDILNRFLSLVSDFLDEPNRQGLVEAVSLRHAFVGSVIKFRTAEEGKSLTGTFLGIDDKGGLLLRADGVVSAYYSGEILP